ncbi:MAG: DUF5615 family PIN-like protein [Candidatus Microthrix sp.]|nr:DUF5615 family PIN-like protein [Candidatus Microthrix sp.]
MWEYAAEQGLVIVSKDSDFRQLAVFDGPPPKLVWLRLGNAFHAGHSRDTAQPSECDRRLLGLCRRGTPGCSIHLTVQPRSARPTNDPGGVERVRVAGSPVSDDTSADSGVLHRNEATTVRQVVGWVGPSRRLCVRSVASPVSGSEAWIDRPAADHNQSTFSGVLRGRRWYLLTRTPERPLGTRPYDLLRGLWPDS